MEKLRARLTEVISKRAILCATRSSSLAVLYLFNAFLADHICGYHFGNVNFTVKMRPHLNERRFQD